ncbi:EF-P 5-aminopentanol modification-associated protein YfmH [Ruminiclostridium cellulolyticum]|uniref:Peptidase M16 domain protein n=1 Tax=Ruminiclostridium cellulolyticum (strain ATCC 35319 / DSM 5812 / JCM 6584 / H10) TaxID=394503 RepID=B8I6G2_RUMCH|nr:pitrilysin family protein [Ruminiclostridium cellulolyticum]ACL74854.1 peptidase M16 domain protein [Ruminiclostridium cellulolyticum H10]
MKFDTIEYKKYNELFYRYEHSSGLNCIVIPKKGYYKKYATFSTQYGSVDNEFIIPGENEPIRVPDGIAHFLEHKLFEQKDGSVMDKFAALGSKPNAFTSFNQTVYLFSCTDLFSENFKLLLNFVQNPYITDESVEREKKIIGQEINMYRDDPGWRVNFNLLKAMYKHHPVRYDIAGTTDSISEITKETLYQCYETFYHPSNMIITVVGDVDHIKVFEQVENGIQTSDKASEIKRIFPKESEGVNKRYFEQNMPVATPLFYMGFKDSNFDLEGGEILRYEIAVKLLLSMIMGKSSKLYEKLYDKGLINASFEMDFSLEKSYAYSMFGGESVNPEEVQEMITNEIKILKKQGLDEEAFNRLLKASKGRFLRQLNSLENISRSFINLYFKGVTMFDYLDVYDKMKFDYITDVFDSHFDIKHMALSVVKQK